MLRVQKLIETVCVCVCVCMCMCVCVLLYKYGYTPHTTEGYNHKLQVFEEPSKTAFFNYFILAVYPRD